LVNYNKIKTTIFIVLGCICFFLTSMYSQTNKGIGFIGASFGDNIISRNGAHIKAKSGIKIYEKDILITRKNGKLQFKLSDNTFVSLGVDSKISISKYNYVPNNENSKIILHSEVGVFKVASGEFFFDSIFILTLSSSATITEFLVFIIKFSLFNLAIFPDTTLKTPTSPCNIILEFSLFGT